MCNNTILSGAHSARTSTRGKKTVPPRRRAKPKFNAICTTRARCAHTFVRRRTLHLRNWGKIKERKPRARVTNVHAHKKKVLKNLAIAQYRCELIYLFYHKPNFIYKCCGHFFFFSNKFVHFIFLLKYSSEILLLFSMYG